MSGKRNFKNPKLTYGYGINDADYVTQDKSTGKVCPYFLVWKNMFMRVFSKREHARRPKYIGTSICKDWHSFSAFKLWMQSQDWHGKQLDKDLIFFGNMHYSPETCCFLTHRVNSFLTDSGSARGEFPIGVCLHKQTGKYAAQIGCPVKKRRHLGLFDDPESAHLAWLNEKHNIAVELAKIETDQRVANALACRYAPGSPIRAAYFTGSFNPNV